VAQRLGHLLDLLRRQDLSKGFVNMVKDAPPRPLDPTAPSAGASESRKWHILINTRLEPET